MSDYDYIRNGSIDDRFESVDILAAHRDRADGIDQDRLNDLAEALASRESILDQLATVEQRLTRLIDRLPERILFLFDPLSETFHRIVRDDQGVYVDLVRLSSSSILTMGESLPESKR